MFSESRTEKKRNEDVIYASDNLWIVGDAASGLTKTDWMHQGSDAAWFSHFLVNRIIKALQPALTDDKVSVQTAFSFPDRPAQTGSLSEILASACQQAAAIFPSCSELEMPSAAIAILYRNESRQQFEYLVLGDCVLLAELVDSQVPVDPEKPAGQERIISQEKLAKADESNAEKDKNNTEEDENKEGDQEGRTNFNFDRPDSPVCKITDSTIASFDGIALDFMKARSQASNEPFLAQRLLANEILIANRKKKNQPDGYAIADCTTRWAGRELTGTIPLSALKRAALYSDGFDQLQTFLQADQTTQSDQDFLNYIFDHQSEILDLLHDRQEQDAACQILPRLKLRDDTSVILVDFPPR